MEAEADQSVRAFYEGGFMASSVGGWGRCAFWHYFIGFFFLLPSSTHIPHQSLLTPQRYVAEKED